MGFIRNDFGQQTIAKRPNAPIVGWALLGVASMMALDEKNREALADASKACLMVWAALELAEGDSGFRRTMGTLTLGWLARRN
ncbi:hypothetical protein P4U43_07225 [Arthrobacter sp. EH-1B-1]|uniref:Uncharacterized protein n=1 Tax=Arthrobacter vasquezii TaxID=2977629 RepID=A0ABT6CU38_9MICC|nr:MULTISPECIES: hypothetical protein [Arthrobacter]KRF09066.1 hypothetical protein ASH00_05255 [Arthrobacter sp. Soil782]MDF9277577.1 hypothetical protein [Arthrobacter vasquezii]